MHSDATVPIRALLLTTCAHKSHPSLAAGLTQSMWRHAAFGGRSSIRDASHSHAEPHAASAPHQRRTQPHRHMAQSCTAAPQRPSGHSQELHRGFGPARAPSCATPAWRELATCCEFTPVPRQLATRCEVTPARRACAAQTAPPPAAPGAESAGGCAATGQTRTACCRRQTPACARSRPAGRP